MSIGPIFILLSPLVVIPNYLLVTYNYPWFVKGFLALLIVLLGLLWQRIRAIENEYIQDRRDQRAKELHDNVVKSTHQENFPVYTLYLRPFSSTNQLATTTEGTVSPSLPPGEHIDLETVLQEALQPKEQLIGLGYPGEMIGAGRISSTDAEWQITIEKLAEHARSILLLPSDHNGTLWEIKLLQSKNWVSKTIWIMPETIERELHALDWSRATEAVKRIGIELPPYEKGGRLFIIGQNGRVSRDEPLAAFFKVRKLRKGLRSLRNANTKA